MARPLYHCFAQALARGCSQKSRTLTLKLLWPWSCWKLETASSSQCLHPGNKFFPEVGYEENISSPHFTLSIFGSPGLFVDQFLRTFEYSLHLHTTHWNDKWIYPDFEGNCKINPVFPLVKFVNFTHLGFSMDFYISESADCKYETLEVCFSAVKSS